ncbi:putative inactive receptor kinase [Zea mays]|uniref:Putative inactive receptor kinase n=1 Tax=Zea mays TaxID=4577 RepID=A0A3L6DGZ1_MAIZE|nr:putative inactive receptor kinase [Zea mays]
MEALGRVEHRNVLPIHAYYISKDEKLLVYDYLPNGSLSVMLHDSGKTTTFCFPITGIIMQLAGTP